MAGIARKAIKKSLEISITYLEKYEDKQLIKFEISYDNNKRSMSLIKTLY